MRTGEVFELWRAEKGPQVRGTSFSYLALLHIGG